MFKHEKTAKTKNKEKMKKKNTVINIQKELGVGGTAHQETRFTHCLPKTQLAFSPAFTKKKSRLM
jgi:hypothetical protein